MAKDPLAGAFGSRMAGAMADVNADVAAALADLGLTDYRPRFSAVVRLVDARGPLTITELAAALHVTHSAASQTVTDMGRRGLVELDPGPSDARHRVVRLTARSRELLPAVDAEWDATARAVEQLGDELSAPLDVIADELVAALRRRSFRDRIADAAADLPRTKYRRALMGERRA